MDIRKKICLLLAALLLAGAVLAPMGAVRAEAAGSFNDVGSGDWFYDAVNFVVGKGLFQGSSATMFNPNGRMTRGMFITVLGRYAKVDPSAWLTGTVTGSDVNMRSGPGTGNSVVAVLSKGTSVTIQGQSGSWYKISSGSGSGYMSADYVSPDYHHFSDVDYSQYYAGYAVWAYEKKIVNGNGSADLFTPDSNITREQLCAMLSRFASVMGASLSQSQSAVTFPDGGNISSWATESVTAMQCAGVVKGDSSGNFRPQGSATRAETATMLQRFDSACGGLVPPAQNPAPKPETQQPEQTNPTPSEDDGTDVPPDDGSVPEIPEITDPGSIADTPASLIGGSVGVKASVIRVGVLVNTKSQNTSVSSVTMQNLNGSGFEYGSMADRTFVYGGSIGDTYITVTTDGAAFTVCDSMGNVVYTGGEPLAIHPVSGGKALTQVNGEYKYYGDFELRQAMYTPGNITVTNFVGVEDYVKGVVPFEFSNSWPEEAMKTAAVVCRSYVMSYDWSIYSSYGMDIVTGSGTQIYYGRAITYDESYFALSDAAVDATSGQYLTYNGQICVTAYSSCDGGATRSAEDVFGTPHPYLVGKTDPYEAAAKGDISSYDSWVSNSHKVGMSAWGCYAMAKYYNKSYEAILGFYYTGTNLQYGA